MTPPIDPIAIARSAVLDAVATVILSLRERESAQVLARIPPTAMLPGGARVVGTSYELEPAMAAAVMTSIVGDAGAQFGRLLRALAKGDADARLAVLKGTPPPTVSALYPHCAGIPLPPGGRPEQAFGRLATSIEGMWGPRQVQKLLEQIDRWLANPVELDDMPLQRFVAQFVRNAPP
jgi:hypothetical protein